MNVVFLIIAAILVMLSGLFSGLNLGLMSFSDEDLRIIVEGSPDEQERRDAATIQPLRKTGNLLLCTLLLGNTLVNAMIAILLSDMTSGVVGGLVTTALIVVFGEIIPQSVCSRYALRIGARSVPLVWLFVGVCFAAAYPIAKLLDYVLGGEMSAVFTKNELKSLILLNVEDPKRQAQSGLTSEDGRILAGALTFKDRKVADVMTPLDSTFALPRNAVLSAATVAEILRSGHTRIPVVLPDDAAEVVALLYAKDLVGIGYERKIPLQQVLDRFRATERVHSVAATTTLGAAFDLCKSKRCHMRVPPRPPKPGAPREQPLVGSSSSTRPSRTGPASASSRRRTSSRSSSRTRSSATTTSSTTTRPRRRSGRACRGRTAWPTTRRSSSRSSPAARRASRSTATASNSRPGAPIPPSRAASRASKITYSQLNGEPRREPSRFRLRGRRLEDGAAAGERVQRLVLERGHRRRQRRVEAVQAAEAGFHDGQEPVLLHGVVARRLGDVEGRELVLEVGLQFFRLDDALRRDEEQLDVVRLAAHLDEDEDLEHAPQSLQERRPADDVQLLASG